MNPIDLIADLGWRDLLDLGLVALILFGLLDLLYRSQERLAVVGLAMLGLLYAAARMLELPLTGWILQGFFAVVVIVLIVVFQDELKRFFERVAAIGLRRPSPTAVTESMDAVTRSVAELAASRRGALIVVPGREPVERHLEGGIPLDARLSEPLLLSLFDPHSPGHDGAVVLDAGRVQRFAVHLPLSTTHASLRNRGTRHAAGLGLAERCDALAIVVSEERGSVSIARDGELRPVATPQDVAAELQRFLEDKRSVATRRNPARALAVRWPQALVALALASLLWVVRVPGSQIVDAERLVRVAVENLPAGFELESVDPPEVRVLFTGSRRAIFLDERADVRVQVDGLLAKLGRRTFSLGPEQVVGAPGVEIVAIQPDKVRIRVRETVGPVKPR